MTDNEPLSSYLFAIEIDGIETARFQKCEGLEAETSVIEIEEGGYGIHHFPGRTRYQNLILEKGINDNNELFNWYKQTLLEDRKIERKNGSIVLKNTENKEIKRWNFFRALPCRWIGPKLDYKNSDSFAVERIDIAHEGLEVDNDNVLPRYFNQRDFSDDFGEIFGRNACAATSLLNELSEQYTANTGSQMTQEQANAAMQNAIDSGNISEDNANVNSWEGAANDMWSSTGQSGNYTYGGENPSAVIYAEDYNGISGADHFTNSNGTGTYHDPWSGTTGTVGDTSLQEGRETRTLTYNPED
ncbi:MAG: phage tail protein [Clostridiaceae bacterium]|nr:phage tail protein [Clostridiaceae bacterium]